MANWLEAALGLGDEAEPIAPPPRQPPEVKSFWVVVAQPTGAPGDLGETVVCHYIVTDGVLWLCDQHGKGGYKPHVLAAGEEPRRVASRLRREAWNGENGRTAFNRSIVPIGPLWRLLGPPRWIDLNVQFHEVVHDAFDLFWRRGPNVQTIFLALRH
jgi:hypothetical protein